MRVVEQSPWAACRADRQKHARQRQHARRIFRACGSRQLGAGGLLALRADTECNSRRPTRIGSETSPARMFSSTLSSSGVSWPSMIQPRSPPCAAVGFWLNWRATAAKGAPSRSWASSSSMSFWTFRVLFGRVHGQEDFRDQEVRLVGALGDARQLGIHVVGRDMPRGRHIRPAPVFDHAICAAIWARSVDMWTPSLRRSSLSWSSVSGCRRGCRRSPCPLRRR